jgi:lipopolysaccharide/colanic/teichoic acid biosynthesis glycosyltransferase
MHRLTLLIFDLVLLSLATAAALLLRDNLEVSPARFRDLLPYLTITLAVGAGVISVMGLNRAVWRLSAMPDYLRIMAAMVSTVILSVAIAFIGFRLEGIARSLPILQCILGTCLLVGSRVAARLHYTMRRRAEAARPFRSYASEGLENVLLVGLNPIAELYLEAAVEFPESRVRVVGLLGRGERHTGRLIQQHKVLGTPEDVVAILRDLEVHGVVVDRIVVTTAFERLSPAARSALLEVERTTPIKLDLFAERMRFDGIAREPVGRTGSPEKPEIDFHFDPEDLRRLAERPYWRAKRLIDIVGALVLGALALPLGVLVALLVAIDVGRPTIFWQQRPGHNGLPFKLWKFRTMAAAHDGAGMRVPDEQRLSRIGRFLRRVRLDELPQLYNILVGEMSFVGPRPLLAGEQPGGHAARLVVRPGLTGWAQVKGGRRVSPADKAALDIWYVQHASLALDFEILWRTVPMLIFGERTNAAAIACAWRELREAGVCAVGSRCLEDGDGSCPA